MSEGVVHSMRKSISALKRLKKIVYRPLWIAAICLAAGGTYYYSMMPRQLDLELDSIVKTTPATVVSAPVPTVMPPVAPVEQRTMVTSSVTPSALPQAAKPVVAAAAVAKLTIMIMAENDNAAVRKINEIMRGHGQLRTKKFTETEKEVSGSLTSHELLTLFARLEPAGKVIYNKKRLEALANAGSIPFVLKLQLTPKTADTSAPLSKPAVKTGATQTTPAEAAVPAPAAAVPATSPAQ